MLKYFRISVFAYLRISLHPNNRVRHSLISLGLKHQVGFRIPQPRLREIRIPFAKDLKRKK